MTSRKRFEVLHDTLCGGWVNTWTVNDKPMTFATREEAQAEIDALLAEIQAEIDSGDRAPDAGYSPDEFRVEEVAS